MTTTHHWLLWGVFPTKKPQLLVTGLLTGISQLNSGQFLQWRFWFYSSFWNAHSIKKKKNKLVDNHSSRWSIYFPSRWKESKMWIKKQRRRNSDNSRGGARRPKLCDICIMVTPEQLGDIPIFPELSGTHGSSLPRAHSGPVIHR